MKTTRYLKICKQIWSLLGDLSATGIGNIPDLVLDIRNMLTEIEQELKDKEFEKE
jgi:hypothetical protein